jgi:hypothetical protein
MQKRRADENELVNNNPMSNSWERINRATRLVFLREFSSGSEITPFMKSKEVKMSLTHFEAAIHTSDPW